MGIFNMNAMNYSKNIYLRSFFWLMSRSLTVFVLFWVLGNLLVDKNKLMSGQKVRSLVYFQPDSYKYLIDSQNGKAAYDKRSWEEYLYYFEKLAQYVPQNASVHGLSGICHYNLGSKDSAIKDLHKAISLAPGVFWFSYDLAVIEFVSHEYEKTIPLLEKALAADPLTTLNMMDSSKQIYGPMLSMAGLDAKALLENIREGHRNAYQILVLSYLLSGDNAGALRSAEIALRANVGEKDRFYFLGGLAAYQLKDQKRSTVYFNESMKEKKDNERLFRDLEAKTPMKEGAVDFKISVPVSLKQEKIDRMLKEFFLKVDRRLKAF